jgi:hypothetical protein
MAKKIIRIGLADFYDVMPITDDEAAHVAAGTVLTKLSDGRIAIRELQSKAGVTKIDLEEEVEARLIADAQAAGKRKSRVQLIADHIENAVMPHHSETEHYVSVSVDGDPELEKYLAARFDVPVVTPSEQYIAAMQANNDLVPAFAVDESGVITQPAENETLVTAPAVPVANAPATS